MSTEANIVGRQPGPNKQLDRVFIGAGEYVRADEAIALVTKLGAERDVAARDMRERCAQVADGMAADFFGGSLIDPNLHVARKIARHLASQLRALPTSVIATEGNGRD